MQITPGEQEDKRRRAEAMQTYKNSPDQSPERLLAALQFQRTDTHSDRIAFDFVFKNEGEVTIRSPSIDFSEVRSERLADQQFSVSFRKRINMPEEIIYPGDERIIEESANSWLTCPQELSFVDGDCVVRWKIFLDNSPPSSGEVDLGRLVEDARVQAVPKS